MPSVPDIEYRLAKPVNDYLGAFQEALGSVETDKVFGCNCVLNYLYSGLEGRRSEGFTGPMTFGEIAYQLLNQTMVYLSLRHT